MCVLVVILNEEDARVNSIEVQQPTTKGDFERKERNVFSNEQRYIKVGLSKDLLTLCSTHR